MAYSIDSHLLYKHMTGEGHLMLGALELAIPFLLNLTSNV